MWGTRFSLTIERGKSSDFEGLSMSKNVLYGSEVTPLGRYHSLKTFFIIRAKRAQVLVADLLVPTPRLLLVARCLTVLTQQLRQRHPRL
jgi:hypothetical protein